MGVWGEPVWLPAVGLFSAATACLQLGLCAWLSEVCLTLLNLQAGLPVCLKGLGIVVPKSGSREKHTPLNDKNAFPLPFIFGG